MECPGQDEVIVDVQFIQPVCEVALVDQTAGLVDYYQGVDDPSYISSYPFPLVQAEERTLCSPPSRTFSGYLRYGGVD